MNPNRYIDLQVNGHGGIDLQSANTVEQIKEVAKSLYKNNVAAFLATIITGPVKNLNTQIQLINAAITAQESNLAGEAKILGIHLEGPFISSEKRGVHPKDSIIAANLEIAKEFVEQGNIKLVTLAPESDGAIEVIKFLVKNNIVVSIGHTNANYDQTMTAIEAGATSVTHLFNGMPKAFDSGIMKAIEESSQVFVQIIVDKIHCTSEQIKFAIDNFANRLIVTNDPIAAAGLGDGEFPFGKMKIVVKDEVARREDGTLAGGVATLDSSVAMLKSFNLNEDQIRAFTYSNALKLLRITL